MRKLTCTSGVLALVLTGWAQALGLGEIYLRSALNEPLRAEIALVGAGGIDESQILTRLATPADFERAGIDRNYELQDLHFAADFTSSSTPLLRVTSQSPVREPYLNFLLELRWPSGRLLREYTLLLDPPGIGVLASDVSPPQPHAHADVPSAADGLGDIAVGSGSHRVMSGETLWQIANRYASSGASVQAMEAAIHRLNPDAFRDGDVNRLLAGATLRLPTTASLERGNDREQHAAALRSAPVSDAAAAPIDRNASALGDTAIIASGASSVAEQLLAALAQVERLKTENNELRRKVAELEAIAGGAPPITEPAPLAAGTVALTEAATVATAGEEANPAIASAPAVHDDAQATESTAAADTGLQADLASVQPADAVAGSGAAAGPPPAEAMPLAAAQRAADTATPVPSTAAPSAAVPLAAEHWLSMLLAPYVPVLGVLAIAMLVLAFLLLRKRLQARLGDSASMDGAEPGAERIAPAVPMAIEAIHIDDEIVPAPEPPPLRATDYLPASTRAADNAADAEAVPVRVDPAGAWAAAFSDADAVSSPADESAAEAIEPAAGRDPSRWGESPRSGGRNDLSATQLELAQAYLDIEDPDGAREILTQVIATGNLEQQAKARALLAGLGRDVVH